MKRQTFFLKFVIFLIGLPILAGCIYGLSRFDPNSPYWALPELAELQYPILIGMYLAMIPFFFALYQILKLLGNIEKGKIFSASTVHALKKIKVCAVLISVIYVIEMPFLYRLTQVDDTPGIFIGLFVIFSSAVIAVFAALLQKRLKDAVAIKAENDLTV